MPRSSVVIEKQPFEERIIDFDFSPRLQAMYAGGTDGHRYLVTARVTDSTGPKLELEGVLEVRDR